VKAIRNILFLGDPYSGYEGFFAKHLRAKHPVRIDMLSLIREKPLTWQEHEDYFDTVHFPNLVNARGSAQHKKSTLARYGEILRTIRELPDYDVCHVQMFSSHKALLLPFLRKKCRKLLVSFWGSDVNKTKGMAIALQKFGLGYADLVTFQTEVLKETFLRKYAVADEPRLRTVHLGLYVLTLLRELIVQQADRQEIRQSLGIPADSICVTCGTYAVPDQNHQTIIEQIEGNRHRLPANLHLLFPMTYGDPGYRATVVERLRQSGLSFTVYDTFLSDEQIARLWYASDILVQVLNKDAFSGATQECLYVGNIVITGSWLSYNILKDRGVRFVEVDDLTQLGDRLALTLDNMAQLKREFAANSDIIWQLSSWEHVINNWVELYTE
jgi:glycosyltransferase involved in cell wall biosynthesis